MNNNRTEGKPRPGQNRVKCEDIQPLLFDYMSRELGEGRAATVREHLRKCRACQVLAKDIQATLDLLRAASRSQPAPAAHLTESRRRKIMRAITHPIISWVERHILLSSFVATVVIVTAVWLFMGHQIEKRAAPLIGDPVSVRILTPGQTNFLEGTNGAGPEVRPSL